MVDAPRLVRAGGGGGIRTHGTHRPTVFKTAPLNRSGTPPRKHARSAAGMALLPVSPARTAPGEVRRGDSGGTTGCVLRLRPIVPPRIGGVKMRVHRPTTGRLQVARRGRERSPLEACSKKPSRAPWHPPPTLHNPPGLSPSHQAAYFGAAGRQSTLATRECVSLAPDRA